MIPGEAPIFIGGCPRSGLTLLRVMLDAHPEISCGPDSGVLSLARAARDLRATLGDLHERDFALPAEKVRENFAGAIFAILDSRRTALGKKRLAEKSAMNLLFFEDYAAMFPGARFIHLVRDGRDVAASLVERAWRDPRSGRLFDHCASLEAAVRYWQGLAAIGLAAERALGPKRVLRLAYETLARTPEAELQRLCAFIGVPYAAQMLEFHQRPLALAGMELESAAALRRPVHSEFIGQRPKSHTGPDAARIAAIAGPELAALGYV